MKTILIFVMLLILSGCKKPSLGKHGYHRQDLGGGEVRHVVQWKDGPFVSLILPESYRVTSFSGSPGSGYILAGEFTSEEATRRKVAFEFSLKENTPGVCLKGVDGNLIEGEGTLTQINANTWSLAPEKKK